MLVIIPLNLDDHMDSNKWKKAYKNQIKRLIGQTSQKGFTLIPLSAYIKRGRVKIELALASGKRLYDKRQTIKRREAAREMQRALRMKNR